MKGMNVSQKGNQLLAMDVARDDQELLVVTENGYGKRTALADYPRKGRGTMGVKTIALTESKGGLAGALVVREHEDLVFISHSGMVQRTSVRGINRYGRGSQGVRVMNLKEDDTVSAIALVAESSQDIEDDEVVILAGPDGTVADGPDDPGGDDADPAPAGKTPPDDE
jgi:DNA gyrase subunit A